MFWPYDSESQGKSLPRPLPIFTMGLMGFGVLVYVLTLVLGGSKKDIDAAKEKVICYYLSHDYTKIPSPTLEAMPQNLQRHHERTAKVMEQYDQAPAMANAQGKKWLRDGDWDDDKSDDKSAQDCMQKAISQGLFSQPPKRRLFVALAQLSSHQRIEHQKKLEALVGAYLSARQRHPAYGWGVIPTERRWFTFFTNFFIPINGFVLFWHLLFLWVAGAFMERRWKGPLWLGIYVISGLLGSILLALFKGGSEVPMLGSGLAVASLMGMWGAAFATREVTLSYWKPGSSIPPAFSFKGWVLMAAWLGLAMLSAVFHPHPLTWLLLLVVHVGIGGGACLALERFGVVAPEEFDDAQGVSLVKGPTFLTEAVSGARNTGARKIRETLSQLETKQQARAQSKAKAAEEALRADLEQKTGVALSKGQKEEAIQQWRAAIAMGKPPLWMLEGLLITSEKTGVVLKAEEYLRAIRKAVHEGQSDKAKTFTRFLMRHRSSGAVTLNLRDQFNLAADLKRASLFTEAITELDDVLAAGEENAFFVKASLLKAESLLQLNRPPQEAMFVLKQTEELLERFPEFRDAIERERQKAQARLNALAAGDEVPGAPAVARATARSGAPGGMRRAVPEDQDNPIMLVPSTRDKPEPTGAFPLPMGTPDDLSREVDVSLLDEIDMFEALRLPQEEDDEPAADSWSELPSLLLHDGPSKKDEAPSMFASGPKKRQEAASPFVAQTASEKKKTQTKMSAQEKLAEEVTAAFDVRDIQPKLNPIEGSGWSAEWSLDSERNAAFEAQQGLFSDESMSGPAREGLPADDMEDFADLQDFANALETPPPPTKNYQASMPSMIPMDNPVKRPKELFETRNISPAVIADGSSLLPDEEKGSYQATLPPGLAAGSPPAGTPQRRPKSPTREAWASVGYPSHAEPEKLGKGGDSVLSLTDSMDEGDD